MISQQMLTTLRELEDEKREAAAKAKRTEELYKAMHKELLARIKMNEVIEQGENQVGLEEYEQFMQPYKKIAEKYIPPDILQEQVHLLGYETRERIVITKALPKAS